MNNIYCASYAVNFLGTTYNTIIDVSYDDNMSLVFNGLRDIIGFTCNPNEYDEKNRFYKNNYLMIRDYIISHIDLSKAHIICTKDEYVYRTGGTVID